MEGALEHGREQWVDLCDCAEAFTLGRTLRYLGQILEGLENRGNDL